MERKYSFDIVRIVAILLVVTCHVVTEYYPFIIPSSQSQVQFMGMSPIESIIGSSLIVAGRYGVPLFLMLSGYFLLPRDYNGVASKQFYQNKFVHLIIVFEIWTVLYQIFLRVIIKQPISISDFVSAVLFLKSDYLPQVWYIPVIIGLYIFVPVLSEVLRRTPRMLLNSILGVGILVGFLLPTLNLFIQAFTNYHGLQLKLDTGFVGSTYGVYFIVGALIHMGILKPIKHDILVAFGVFSFVELLVTQFIIQYSQHAPILWYDQIFLLSGAAIIMELAERVKFQPSRRAQKLIMQLSQLSLGVYLIHVPLKMIQRHFFFISVGTLWLSTLLEVFLLILVSYLLIYLINLVPYFRKWLLFGK